ncbi:vacuole membrane protein 1-like isoform X1 [Osmia bicornis bicornis]|uniref:vacuole membrane protein 1-like isoform X1 n=2 Tax=Osmia bicornis bicornis TaxID=1437191 RepID=UPI0010F85910|nr:vacuole membrane protein 1-like isoform X1 [Osmia bicornis bicornis]XP_029036900.1 vacuole membrane protein 1-like isoform X1 [Osmia bicornis bicornis]XP_029036901.1 vacuole membrane protein 1-like isoform X1 [Osmia bicornis bicornis]
MVRRKVDRKTSNASNMGITNNVKNFDGNFIYTDSRSTMSATTVVPVSQLKHKQFKGLLKEHLPISGKRTNMVYDNSELGNIMLENTTAIRRVKDSAPINGAQQNIEQKKLSAPFSEEPNNLNNESHIDSESLTLWQHPITTLNYFFRELFSNVFSLGRKALHHRRIVWSIISITVLILILNRISGPHQQVLRAWETKIIWWLYWIGLGVLSSVGLGTGLHTFVLYLGPHIAAVTMAAYECGALNFPEPPYPDQIICPTTIDPMWTAGILNIMRKVRIEAMLWGAGTALGELPPYFMARAARTSRHNNRDEKFDQEDLKELEALEALENGENVSLLIRIKLTMKHFVQKAGFWGILACASIPNPLFDLAGLTCGHYLIPFWTFFGATLIGKAIIKMHIQQLAVIIAFNEELLDKFIKLLAIVPYVGSKFQEPLKKYLIEQKKKLHDKTSMDGTTTISWLFDKFVMLMVCYFLVTIIHALARNYHRKRTKRTD